MANTKNWEVGETATIKRAFSAADVANYARLTGDNNPIHLDEVYAANDPRFGQRIVHGMLAAGLFSAIFGARMPGEGTIYLGQELSFRAPIFLGEEITATATLVKVREDKPIGTIETTATKADGTVVIEGKAVVVLP